MYNFGRSLDETNHKVREIKRKKLYLIQESNDFLMENKNIVRILF